ncbi:MAG: hypothetical protein ABI599_09115 [Flavobacteriales bacterium]
MVRILILLALLVASATCATAQTPVPDQKDLGSACILATDATVWASLGLSEEQLKKVQSIQTQCKTDCVTGQESGEVAPELAGAALKRHEEDVEKILTEEQYNKWMKWCSERPGHT